MRDLATAGFGATSTAAEVVEGVSLEGRRALVTGGASGIGRETARALASAGATVTLAVRSLDAGTAVARQIDASVVKPGGGGVEEVRVAMLDLANPASVAAFVRQWRGPLDILVANAGVMATPETRTPEGRELQFATNHLGHFQLALGLHPALSEAAGARAAGAAFGARVVVVSSVGHINGDVLFDDVDFARTPYDPWAAYSQSKTANILFAVEAARLWAADGIAVNALNPGRIADTGLSRHLAEPPASFDPSGSTGVSVKSIAEGAATSVLLASSPLVDALTGRYFEDCAEAAPLTPGIRRGVAPYALDAAAAARLWRLSADLLAASGYAVA